MLFKTRQNFLAYHIAIFVHNWKQISFNLYVFQPLSEKDNGNTNSVHWKTIKTSEINIPVLWHQNVDFPSLSLLREYMHSKLTLMINTCQIYMEALILLEHISRWWMENKWKSWMFTFYSRYFTIWHTEQSPLCLKALRHLLGHYIIIIELWHAEFS